MARISDRSTSRASPRARSAKIHIAASGTEPTNEHRQAAEGPRTICRPPLERASGLPPWDDDRESRSPASRRLLAHARSNLLVVRREFCYGRRLSHKPLCNPVSRRTVGGPHPAEARFAREMGRILEIGAILLPISHHSPRSDLQRLSATASTSSRSVTRLDAVDAVHRHDVGAREVREGRSSHPVALAIRGSDNGSGAGSAVRARRQIAPRAMPPTMSPTRQI